MSQVCAQLSPAQAAARQPRLAVPSAHESGLQARALIQLVAPGTGGVRDYMSCLKSQWRTAHIHSHVIALSQADAMREPLTTRLQKLIHADGRPCTVVLHFSGYGFHPRGLCSWLAREVEAARKQLGEKLRLITMFHELFATGPAWSSAFWVSGLQASIATRIARASDALWTNTELHGQWLRSRVDDAVPIEIQPVFSNIGEPKLIPAANGREARLIVFGSQSTRGRALQLLPRHAALLHTKGIREVVEVGSGTAHPWTERFLRHQFMGQLDANNLRSLLEKSAYGLIDYPPTCLAKSSVFAAYAAHGITPVNTAEPGKDSDGLQSGKHFVSLPAQTAFPQSAEVRQAISDAGRAWYSKHALPVQAQVFLRSCRVTQAA